MVVVARCFWWCSLKVGWLVGWLALRILVVMGGGGVVVLWCCGGSRGVWELF